jgi:superfamily II DNA or RNA helicase
MKLRPYQEELVEKVRQALRRVRRVLVQCPTGGGKTAIATFIAKGILSKRKRVWFLCHRDFLVDQTGQTWTGAGIDFGEMAAGRWFNPYPLAHVGMIQTVKSRLDRLLAEMGEPDYVIWDEAHHIAASTWQAIMDALPNAKHVGLSATPIRLDGKGLDANFDEIVLGPTTAWLIENGYLSDYRAFAPSTVDLTGVHSLGGDYRANELDAAIQKSVIVGDIVGHYKRLAMHKRAVYFAHNIARSKELADAFNDAGIPAQHLDGTSSSWERGQAAQLFARNGLRVLVNVDLFGEGYDLAAQAQMDVTIEAVGLCRPTQSVGLHLQQIGRALRPKPEPAIILDHAGNLEKLGLPDDARAWSLQGETSEPVELTRCDGCGAMVRATTIVCRHCGTKLRDVKQRGPSLGGGRHVEQVDGELHEIDKETRRRQEHLEELKCANVYQLQDLAKRRGYNDPLGWAAYMWTLNAQRKRAGDDGDSQEPLPLYDVMADDPY